MLFSADKTNSAINECGIDASLVRSNESRFLEICQKISSTSLEARNAVVETLAQRKEKLLGEINLIDKTVERKRNVWSDMQIADLENTKIAFQGRIDSLEKVQSCSDKRNRQKFQQMVKRKATALVSEHSNKRLPEVGGWSSKQTRF